MISFMENLVDRWLAVGSRSTIFARRLASKLYLGILGAGKMSRSLIAGGSPVKLLQTDSAINPGNSGEPMFNQQGEAIGIVSFILSKSGGFNGIGFATSVDTAHDALINSSGFWAGFEV